MRPRAGAAARRRHVGAGDRVLGFTWLGPIVGPLGTAGLVVVMVIFMLLERRDLRDRMIGLFGHGQLSGHDEGVRRGRYTRQPATVDAVRSSTCSTASSPALGLYLLDVPYPLVWAALGAVLRFIPYVGPILGAGAPILVSLAALRGLGRTAVP